MNRQDGIIKNKIQETSAFTLAEALVAILIMLMVSSIMVAGIPAARRAYENVVTVSNAELLMSTTVSALRNELGMATNVDTPDKNDSGEGLSVTYYNPTYGTVSKILKHTSGGSDDSEPAGTIMLQRYAAMDVDGTGTDDTVSGGSEVRLVSKKASDEHLYVTYDTVNVTEGGSIITFSGLKVVDAKNGKTIAPVGRSKDTLSIRLLANNPS